MSDDLLDKHSISCIEFLDSMLSFSPPLWFGFSITLFRLGVGSLDAAFLGLGEPFWAKAEIWGDLTEFRFSGELILCDDVYLLGMAWGVYILDIARLKLAPPRFFIIAKRSASSFADWASSFCYRSAAAASSALWSSFCLWRLRFSWAAFYFAFSILSNRNFSSSYAYLTFLLLFLWKR